MTNLGQINFRRSILSDKELMGGGYGCLENTVNCLALYKIKQGFSCEGLIL